MGEWLIAFVVGFVASGIAGWAFLPGVECPSVTAYVIEWITGKNPHYTREEWTKYGVCWVTFLAVYLAVRHLVF